VQVRDGQARLARTGSLAGSTLTMDVAVRRAVQVSGLSVADASAAASGTPARLLGRRHEFGAIEAGLAADLVVLDPDLTLRRVLSAGRWVPSVGTAADVTELVQTNPQTGLDH
jgi:N-acetylglucosamine-6-phosphate deacetylase